MPDSSATGGRLKGTMQSSLDDGAIGFLVGVMDVFSSVKVEIEVLSQREMAIGAP